MSAAKPFRLDSLESFGGRLEGLIQRAARPGPRPTVVICHGFKGFMEWGFFPSLADLLAHRGMTVVRFNFSGSGMRPGDDRVSDQNAFRRNTFSLELAEILRVLEALPELAEEIDVDRVALLGHSRGGGSALLASAREPWRARLKALVTWSAVAIFDRYGLDAKEQWRRDGALPITNARTGQQLHLGVELLDDVEQNRQALDLQRAAASRRAPWLIVHGADDETVPPDEATALFKAAGGEQADGVSLRLIDGASHTFGARHPFAAPTPALIQAMNATQLWLRRHLEA